MDQSKEFSHFLHCNQSTSDISKLYNDKISKEYDVTTPPIPKYIKALEHYGVPVICILGIIGDVISLLVFVCTSFRYQPCSQYLAALAFVDTLFLISNLLITSVNMLPITAIMLCYCSVIVYVSYVCSFLSAWFVVLMMSERNIVVCYPFRASTFCNRKKSYIVMFMTTLFAMTVYSQSFFTTVIKLGACIVDETYIVFLRYFTCIDSVLVFFVPFFSVVGLNLKIITEIGKFRKHHDLCDQSIRISPRVASVVNTLSLAQVRSTRMLVWVSSVFILLHMPSYLVRMCGLLLRKYIDITDNNFYVIQSFCQFLYYLKFSLDIFAYLFTNNKFKHNCVSCITRVKIEEQV